MRGQSQLEMMSWESLFLTEPRLLLLFHLAPWDLSQNSVFTSNYLAMKELKVLTFFMCSYGMQILASVAVLRVCIGRDKNLHLNFVPFALIAYSFYCNPVTQNKHIILVSSALSFFKASYSKINTQIHNNIIEVQENVFKMSLLL